MSSLRGFVNSGSDLPGVGVPKEFLDHPSQRRFELLGGRTSSSYCYRLSLAWQGLYDLMVKAFNATDEAKFQSLIDSLEH